MTDPYLPPAVENVVDERHDVDERVAICRCSIAAMYGLAAFSGVLHALGPESIWLSVIFFQTLAAPATLWAYLDANIRGERLKSTQLATLVVAWPLGLLVHFITTRRSRGFCLWMLLAVTLYLATKSLLMVWALGMLIFVLLFLCFGSLPGQG